METFLKHFAAATNTHVAAVAGDTRLADLPNWDSLAILTTISMLDIEYAISVSGTELQNCESVRDVYDLATGKGNRSSDC